MTRRRFNQEERTLWRKTDAAPDQKGSGAAHSGIQLVWPLHPTNHMLGHAAAEGQPLSGHRTALSPVPSTCVAVVVGVLHVGIGGITVATTVLLFPTSPVT